MDEGNVSRAEILPLLGPGKKMGGWFMAFCPAHPDGSKHNGKAGYSLGLSDEGVLRCFAGCSFKDVMEKLRADIPSTPKTKIDPAQKELVATYEYRDTTGKLVGIKGRFEWPNPDRGKNDKEFKWKPPGADRWVGGVKMPEMPLWGSELLPTSSARVWFTEGEKACEALRARNEIAVCAGGGSSQTDFGDALEVLRGRDVWLWPDNDEPGRKYLKTMKSLLQPIVERLIIVQPRNMPEAGDAHDFFSMGRSLQEIEEMVQKPTTVNVADGYIRVTVPTNRFDVDFVWTGFSRVRGEFNAELTVRPRSMFDQYDPIHTRINVMSQSAVSTLRLSLEQAFGGGRGDQPLEPNWASVINRSIARMRDAYEEMRGATVEHISGDSEDSLPPLLCGPYVMDGGGTFLFGPPGKGKSTMALLWAVSMDAGCDYLFPVVQQKVMYINLERDRNSMARRLARINAVLGLEEDRPLLMLNARGSILSDLLDTVRSAIAKHGVQGVFLDSVSRSGYGDMIDNAVANRVADALNSLGLWWVAIAHSPRGDDTHIYGSVMFDAAADIMVNISSEMSGGGEAGIGLQITKANDQAVTGDVDQFAFAYNEGGLIEVRRARRDEYAELTVRKKLSLVEAVSDHLGRNGEATASQIAEATGKPRESISRLLNNRPEWFIKRPAKGDGGVYFGLRAQD